MKKNTQKDVQLILDVQSGSEEAFEKLYVKYEKTVYFIAYELCRNEADARDVVQETFVQIHKSIASLQDPSFFKSWLYRIVSNKCKNLFRANKTVNFDEENSYYGNQLLEKRAYMMPDKDARYKSDQELLHFFVQQLPIAQREVFILRFFQDMSMKEMAETLQVAEGTIKTRLLYGKSAVREMIQSYERENETKLNFKSLDGALLASFSAVYATQCGISLPSLPKMKVHNSFTSHILSGTLGKVVIAGGMLVGGGAGTIALVQKIQEQDYKELPQATISTLEDTQARSYYFELLHWASDKDDMQVASDEEMKQIYTTYLALKETNSAYYKRLVKDQWATTFELLYQ